MSVEAAQQDEVDGTRTDYRELEAAVAGKVRCAHCGLWVAPHEAGRPRRH